MNLIGRPIIDVGSSVRLIAASTLLRVGIRAALQTDAIAYFAPMRSPCDVDQWEEPDVPERCVVSRGQGLCPTLAVLVVPLLVALVGSVERHGLRGYGDDVTVGQHLEDQ